MTLTQDIELPNEGLSPDCRDLLEGLLKRDVPDRLGCKGRGQVLCFFFYLPLREHCYYGFTPRDVYGYESILSAVTLPSPSIICSSYFAGLLK